MALQMMFNGIMVEIDTKSEGCMKRLNRKGCHARGPMERGGEANRQLRRRPGAPGNRLDTDLVFIFLSLLAHEGYIFSPHRIKGTRKPHS